MDSIDIIKSELIKIREDLIDLRALEKELKLIEEKINSYGDINYNEIGFKSAKTFTIDDILRKDEAIKNIIENDILTIKYKSKLKDYKIYIELLCEDEQNIINEMYMKNLDKDKISFRVAALITKFSKSQVENLHNKALQNIYNKMIRHIEI